MSNLPPGADRAPVSPDRDDGPRRGLALSDADLDALAERIASRVASLPQPPPPLLDLSGVAQALNVSERTVENFVAAGELPVVRLGTGKRRGLRRFDPEAVTAFIRRRARSL